jgi:nitric oxide reductase NorQ protein
MLVISYNPGYQNLLKSLKPSTRQRFVALSFGYPDEATERAIVRTESGVDDAVARQLVALAGALRRLTEHDLEETASTRLLVMAGRLVASGLPMADACRAAIVDALTDDNDTAAALAEVVGAVLDDPGT